MNHRERELTSVCLNSALHAVSLAMGTVMASGSKAVQALAKAGVVGWQSPYLVHLHPHKAGINSEKASSGCLSEGLIQIGQRWSLVVSWGP